jgi:hypothetical protein
MALNVSKLENDLLNTFTAMNTITDGSGNEYFAEQMAAAVFDFALSGQTATVDSGTTPAGTYAGAGAGTMSVSAADLKALLKLTFENCNDNNALADDIADNSDGVCAADNTVSETSNGIVTTASGAVSAFSGTAIGKFTGAKSILSGLLSVCFTAMNSMTEGGNEYLARQMSAAYNTYFTQGSIAVTLKVPPFASGSGSGSIQ